MAKPLRVGLLGAGPIAYAHMAAYLEYPDQVRLTAVCDLNLAAAETYAKQVGVPAVYSDVHEMLRRADIDAVGICSRHDLHPSQAIAAAEAGKHLLCETAMAPTLSGCQAMIDAADAAEVTLMIAQNLRFSRTAMAIKHLIDRGGLGEIQAVRAHASFGAGTSNPQGHWANDGRRAGGGILMTHSIHHVDLLRFFLGNVRRVVAVCRSVQREMVNGAEDLIAATVEFESGAIGAVFSSQSRFLVPDAMSCAIFGSEGTLLSTPPAAPGQGPAQIGTAMVANAMLRDPGSGSWHPRFEPVSTVDVNLPSRNPYVNEILHFAECCRTGQEPMTSGHDNIQTIKLIMAIYESSRTGAWVDLDSR
ncbi:MAG: Gfo/Idh/MocA family oxidoreductase [Proteobacteria bacterium]|nr:Gfo/Idh/MocA family oxidoreductase [Pseudomonadota bacterium]